MWEQSAVLLVRQWVDASLFAPEKVAHVGRLILRIIKGDRVVHRPLCYRHPVSAVLVVWKWPDVVTLAAAEVVSIGVLR